MGKLILVYILIIISGLSYGWVIIKHPIVAQIIAGGMALAFLFILSLAIFPLSKIK